MVAGEESGDRLAARALAEVKNHCNSKGVTTDLYGIGGNHCKALGVRCYHHADEMSVVGFAEVASRYFFFKRVLREMVNLLDSPATRPDVLFLVDYPGFNLPLAREAKKRGIRVVFYVSPQVWAWKSSRIKKIVASVSEMVVIFPFEAKLYLDAGLAHTYFVGHPLLEIIEQERNTFSSREAFGLIHGLDASKQWLAIFPGSRNEEVRRHQETMCNAAIIFCKKHNFQPVFVESESVAADKYSPFPSINHFRSAGDVHELMFHADLGILKSGTTTLEAALMGLPGVICYKTSVLTYQIAKRLIKLPFIGLANIVLGRKLYPELIQDDFQQANIVTALDSVLMNASTFSTELKQITNILQSPDGSPSLRVAEILLGDVQ